MDSLLHGMVVLFLVLSRKLQALLVRYIVNLLFSVTLFSAENVVCSVACSENLKSFNCIGLCFSFRCRTISKHIIKLSGTDGYSLRWLNIKHVLLLIDGPVNN